MSILTWKRWPMSLLVLPALLLSGCGEAEQEVRTPGKEVQAVKPAAGPKKVNVSQNIWFEVDGDKRRVLVSAVVCLRKGPLEQLLTRKGQKEHEAVLAADIDARQLHAALELAGARAGSPVQFVPRYRPATGSAVRVSVMYDEKGQKQTVNARTWIRNQKTKAELECDWVFAGSMLVDNPFDATAPKRYMANDGDVVCISNFETALLDVPIQSSKGDEERSYEAWSERIPEEGTRVVVIFEPIAEGKK